MVRCNPCLRVILTLEINSGQRSRGKASVWPPFRADEMNSILVVSVYEFWRSVAYLSFRAVMVAFPEIEEMVWETTVMKVVLSFPDWTWSLLKPHQMIRQLVAWCFSSVIWILALVISSVGVYGGSAARCPRLMASTTVSSLCLSSMANFRKES